MPLSLSALWWQKWDINYCHGRTRLFLKGTHFSHFILLNIVTCIPTAWQRVGKHIPATTEHPLLGNGPVNMHSWQQDRSGLLKHIIDSERFLSCWWQTEGSEHTFRKKEGLLLCIWCVINVTMSFEFLKDRYFGLRNLNFVAVGRKVHMRDTWGVQMWTSII
jgi:hypothetical protein